MRDAERIEAQSDESSESSEFGEFGESSESNDSSEQQSIQQSREPYPGATEKIAPWRFQPGQSGNPGGKPKTDMSAIIARAIFENNPQMLYEAYAKALKKGSGFTFQVLSDRAYGKLKESLEVSGNLSLSERMEKARKRVKK